MIELKPLAEVDQALFDQAHAEALARVQEDNTRLYLRIGVLADILIHYHALLAAQRQENIDEYLKGRSLLALEENPDLADPDLVDDVISNYRLERKPGSTAEGEVTVVVSDDVSVVVAQGSVWQANGRRFLTPTVFTAKTEAGQINSASDRLLTLTSDGNYAFTIDVVAEDEGPEGEVKKDTTVVPLVVPPNYVTSFAASDFSGGTRAETNQEVLQRLREGIAAKVMSGRVAMSAMLKDVEAFSGIVANSVIGYGDAEMHRDRHWIFPVSGGGRADWYVRTQQQVLRKKITKSASLVEVGADRRGVWQLAVTRDDAPGFYELTNVRPKDDTDSTGGFEVVEETRSLDLTGDGLVPDVAAQYEGAYSRFQTAVIKFRDTVTDASALSFGHTQEYDVEARCMPLVADIQDHVSGRGVRHHGADVLIKAPVPCFLQLSLTVYKRAGEDDPDVDGIKAALCEEVNTIGFIGRLYASQLHDVVHSYLRNDQTVSAIDMFGRIRYPDDSTTYLRDSEVLAVPDEPEALVTPRTVQFFLAAEDVSISVITSVLPGT
jgi:hypothetical protein